MRDAERHEKLPELFPEEPVNRSKVARPIIPLHRRET